MYSFQIEGLCCRERSKSGHDAPFRLLPHQARVLRKLFVLKNKSESWSVRIAKTSI